MSFAIVFFALFAICQIMAAVNDALSMKIPNIISLVLLAGFVLITPFAWVDFATFGEHILVGLGVFAVAFGMFAAGWLGGGDAKLLAATAFWWQAVDLFPYLLVTAIAGGALALFLIIGRRYIPVGALTSPWLYRMFKDETKMPYGIALAIGALVTLPKSQIYLSLLGA
jgi:prepilin peptidase CpaA